MSMLQQPGEYYFPVHLEVIPLDSIRTFDIFIRVKNSMVLYHKGGERFTAEVRDNLLANHIEVLYIRKSEREVFEHFLADNLRTILSNPHLSAEDRAKLAYTSITNIARTLFDTPRSHSIVLYKSAIAATMDFVMREETAMNNLIRLTSHDFTTYIHSVNVGVFSIGLAKALLAHDPAHNMNELASGFFLHDIGKCSTPLNVLNKPGPLNEEEWKIMRRHPYEGYKLLDQLNALTKESKVIVMQHHERHNGKGYPRGLRGNQIHTYSKICLIADVFDALTAVRPYKDSKTPFQALQIMKYEMRSEFDPDFFSQFVLMFGDGFRQK
jgi:HD-GYP domain-containing protein (c-di-GMP phosphodiesterase class II)